MSRIRSWTKRIVRWLIPYPVQTRPTNPKYPSDFYSRFRRSALTMETINLVRENFYFYFSPRSISITHRQHPEIAMEFVYLFCIFPAINSHRPGRPGPGRKVTETTATRQIYFGSRPIFLYIYTRAFFQSDKSQTLLSRGPACIIPINFCSLVLVLYRNGVDFFQKKKSSSTRIRTTAFGPGVK